MPQESCPVDPMGPAPSVTLLPGSTPHARVSLHTGGGEITTLGSKGSSYPSVALDNNRIAFATTAEDTPAGTNTNPSNFNQFWTRDLALDVSHLVTGITHTPTGRVDPANAGSDQGSINGSGKFVVFQSEADDFTVFRQTQLGKKDLNEVDDVWIYDTGTFRLSRLSSRPFDGAGGNNRSYGPPEASSDGQWITFTTAATNLVNANTFLGDCDNRPRGGGDDVVLLDRGSPDLDVEPENNLSSRKIHWVSHGVEVQLIFPSGQPVFLDCVQPNGPSKTPSLSANGCKIAYLSQASNLSVQDQFVQQDPTPTWHVYVFDRATGKNELISKSDSGELANGDCSWPEISADGRFVVYSSVADNLDPLDPNGAIEDVFLRDLQAGTTRIVTLAQDGQPFVGNGYSGSRNPEISPSGRFFTFANLVDDPLVSPQPTPRDYITVLIYDRDADHDGTLTTAFSPSEFVVMDITLNDDGSDGDGHTAGPLMFGGDDAEYVYVPNESTALVSGDTNGPGQKGRDVFRRPVWQ